MSNSRLCLCRWKFSVYWKLMQIIWKKKFPTVENAQVLLIKSWCFYGDFPQCDTEPVSEHCYPETKAAKRTSAIIHPLIYISGLAWVHQRYWIRSLLTIVLFMYIAHRRRVCGWVLIVQHAWRRSIFCEAPLGRKSWLYKATAERHRQLSEKDNGGSVTHSSLLLSA